MDESKPPIPPGEFHLRSTSEWTSGDIDPAPGELAKAAEFVTVGRQNRSGQIETGRNDPCDRPSVAVYYRNEEEVREGFLIALSAMGVADLEQNPEPVKPLDGGVKP